MNPKINASPANPSLNKVQRLNAIWDDFEKLMEDRQQCLFFGWEWKGVWVCCEEMVVIVPDVSVTLLSSWMVPDATTVQPSIDSVQL